MEASNGTRSGSGDEGSSDTRKGKRQYHRHSTEQVQQLDSFFKEHPHPDENQRLQLSRKLGLDSKQIKFWFQNKRSQKKAQNERTDNNTLRAENERIRCENMAMREALKNIICPSCRDPLLHNDNDKQNGLLKLKNENMRLRQQHERTMSFVTNGTGKPAANSHVIDSFTSTTLDGDRNWENQTSDFCMSGMQETDRAMILEAASAAMDELIELLRVEDPLWISSANDGRSTLHRDSYDKLFPKPNHFKSAAARIESSKESGEVAMLATTLLEAFLDPVKWKDMFPSIVTKARTIQVLDAGISFIGSLHLMYEKMHILSPLVAPREFFFIRHCRQMNTNTWAVVDVSYDVFRDSSPSRCWKLPSGCIIKDKGNGKTEVAWVEHVQVDDKSLTHRLYRDLVCGSHAYGAKRWIVTLQRMCERAMLALGPTTGPTHQLEGVIESAEGRRNVMKLSQRMVRNFCEMLNMSDRLDFPHLSELYNSGVRVSLRKSDGLGQPQGLIVSAATSLWLPFRLAHLFKFFTDEDKRAQWDILSSGNPVNSIARISTGENSGNCVSIIQPFVPKENMLMLQESSIDSLGGSIIYAPVELTAVSSVVDGEDIMTIPILPSGYVISGDGRRGVEGSKRSCGSLLTVAFQMLVCSDSVSKQLNMESVATLHSLISSTVQKIKLALHCPDLD
ncbi:homeobox-leucine zipper protein ROC8-like [Salvia splendens]|uniref:homeobox-leucine zipper protein ROC8-like n=1 Tax=Salvia splendens TaxID=180675 RepID=UPI001C267492|nr:homeobox-leucine zipper protein ROC8-like [Salvia splendens]